MKEAEKIHREQIEAESIADFLKLISGRRIATHKSIQYYDRVICPLQGGFVLYEHNGKKYRLTITIMEDVICGDGGKDSQSNG